MKLASLKKCKYFRMAEALCPKGRVAGYEAMIWQGRAPRVCSALDTGLSLVGDGNHYEAGYTK